MSQPRSYVFILNLEHTQTNLFIRLFNLDRELVGWKISVIILGCDDNHAASNLLLKKMSPAGWLWTFLVSFIPWTYVAEWVIAVMNFWILKGISKNLKIEAN